MKFEFTKEDLEYLRPLDDLRHGAEEKMREYISKVIAKRLQIHGLCRFNFDLRTGVMEIIPQKDVLRGNEPPPRVFRRLPNLTR